MKDDKVLYARNIAPHGSYRREWDTSNDVRQAYEFRDRTDARAATRAKFFEEYLKGPRYQHGWDIGRNGDLAFYWEVLKVTETIVTSFEEEIVTSNAPPMVQLARAAS